MAAGLHEAHEASCFFRLLGVLAPLASCLLLWGCGSTPSSLGYDDAGLSTAVTQGGGLPGTSSSSGSSGGSGSGAEPSSGSSSGTSSSGNSSSGSSSSGASSGSGSGNTVDASAYLTPDGSVDCTGYMPPTCGSAVCDLRSNTCCVTLAGAARCVPGANAKCMSNEVTGHCQYICDCATPGTVCCAVGNTVTQTLATECQAVPKGGHCSPYPQTSTTASAQLCALSAECRNSEQCLKQTCIYNTTLYICGLQTQDPFYCH